MIRFETAPGRQAQVDFADFRFPWGKRYALVVVLGYSPLLWVRFFTRKDMRALLDGLEEAFSFFGGVPEELVTNAEFVRFAAHYDFKVRVCRPYRAQTKGKVELPISLPPEELRVRPRRPKRRRPGRPAPALARPDRERAAAPHDPGASGTAVRAR